MPPKKNKASVPTNKTLEKEKKKVVDDKTFGLKNANKSKKVQGYIKQVTNQVMDGGHNGKGGIARQEEAKHKEKEEKKKSAAQKALLASLFKGVVQLTVNEDGEVDKKKTLCPYFKAGVCEKGKKCKYSHDLALEDTRNMAIDLYTDPRVKTGKAPDTIITCRDFLEAVEKELYGFNWTCPNAGDNCTYLHRLPEGYVLNRDKKKDGEESSDDEDKQTLEELIEEERANLNYADLTPVTLETFNQWKIDRAARKQAEIEAKMVAEEAKGRKDRSQMAFMSGKALFQYNPDLFVDDDGAAQDEDIFEDDEEEKDSNSDSDEETQEDGAAAGQNGASGSRKQKGQSNEEEKKQEVQVDAAAFAGEAGADEDVDFD